MLFLGKKYRKKIVSGLETEKINDFSYLPRNPNIRRKNRIVFSRKRNGKFREREWRQQLIR